MRDWDNDLNHGKQAEEMVQFWFGGKLGNDDLLIRCEIKNTWHGSFICLEEDSIVEEGKKGWIYTATADNVIFVDYKNEQAVLINMDILRSTYNEIKENYPLKTDSTSANNKTWHSTHRKIPVNKFGHCFLKYMPPSPTGRQGLKQR